MTTIALRMGRVTWHRHRWAVTAILVVFGAAIAALVAESIATTVALDANGVAGCLNMFASCSGLTAPDRFYSVYTSATTSAALTAHLLLVVPPVVALFAGVPWLTREFETGSYRYTWVQGVPPARWLLGTFGSLAGIALVSAAAYGAAFYWWYPITQDAVNVVPYRGWDWDAFGMSPIAMVGWTAFAMALAMLIAALIRLTVPAMAAFAVIYAGCLFIGEQYLRPWVLSLAPVVVHGSFYSITFAPTWSQRYVVNRWLTGPNGQALSPAHFNSVINTDYEAMHGITAVSQLLTAQHYTFWEAYQPASGRVVHELAFALILLAASALCVLTAVRLIRRRLPHP
jgi:hypothetical protein